MMRASLFVAVMIVAGCTGCSKSGEATPNATAPSNGGDPGVPVIHGKGIGAKASGAAGAADDGASGTMLGAPGAPVNDPKRLQPAEGTLAVTPPADIKSGAPSVATVTVTPGAGYHVNKDYPTKLTITPPAGVTLAKAELTAGGRDSSKGDADTFDEQLLKFAVSFTAAQPGNYTLNGSFKFAVCDHDSCHPKTEQIAIAIAAK